MFLHQKNKSQPTLTLTLFLTNPNPVTLTLTLTLPTLTLTEQMKPAYLVVLRGIETGLPGRPTWKPQSLNGRP